MNIDQNELQARVDAEFAKTQSGMNPKLKRECIVRLQVTFLDNDESFGSIIKLVADDSHAWPRISNLLTSFVKRVFQ